jgi:diacylglycerol kinase family enzyme
LTRALIVANPVSGQGRAAQAAPALEKALADRGIAARTVFTKPQPADDELDAAILDAEAVVAMGGDGTLNRVARPIVLRGTGTPAPAVSFCALGTGNVAVRAFRQPQRPDEIAGLVARGSVRGIDAGVVRRNGEVAAVFVLWLGAGLDGALIHAVAASRARHLGSSLIPRYALEGSRLLATYAFPPVEVRAERMNGTFASVMLANVGEMVVGSVTRNADPSDGEVDVVATAARSRLGWCLAGVLAGLNAYDRCPGVSRSRETRVALRSSAPLPLHVDGEPCGELPVEVEMRASALSLLA